MWIFTKAGFFSVVQDRDNPDMLLLRSRKRLDLENLCQIAKVEDDIWNDPQADYPWRMRIEKEEFSRVAGEMVFDINYDNFKNTIARQNPNRAVTYAQVWADLLEIEKEK